MKSDMQTKSTTPLRHCNYVSRNGLKESGTTKRNVQYREEIKLKSVSWTQAVGFKANCQNIHKVWTRKRNKTFPAKQKMLMKTMELLTSLNIPKKPN
jgi:predicted Rdx family selenoprotein